MSSSPLSVLRKSKRNQWGRSHGSWGTSRSLRCLPTCSAPRDRCPSPGPTPVKCTRALSSPRAFWPRACGRRSLLCSLGAPLTPPAVLPSGYLPCLFPSFPVHSIQFTASPPTFSLAFFPTRSNVFYASTFW